MPDPIDLKAARGDVDTTNKRVGEALRELSDTAYTELAELRRLLADSKRREAFLEASTDVLAGERDRLAAEFKEAKQLEWEAMGHAARWEEQVEQLQKREAELIRIHDEEVKRCDKLADESGLKINQLNARVKTLEDALKRINTEGLCHSTNWSATIAGQALAAKEPKDA